jgi:hypothetical protein
MQDHMAELLFQADDEADLLSQDQAFQSERRQINQLSSKHHPLGKFVQVHEPY